MKAPWKLHACFVGALFLLVTIGLVAQNRISRSVEDAGWVLHTDTVLTELEGVSEGVYLAENDERGYLLTGDRELLGDSTMMKIKWQITSLGFAS